MSADRFEISDHGSKLTVRDTKYGSEVSMLRVRSYSRELTVMAGAIRQQARDIAALKDALADEVTANEAFRKAGGARDDEDMPTFCARLIAGREQLRADLATAVAERDWLLAELADSYTKLASVDIARDVAEARLAAIDSAPTVAYVDGDNIGIECQLQFPAFNYQQQHAYFELIARPAKD